ncbi:DNA polymerase III subunit alpha [Candidatus Falkowbacteria bacterium]|uniref:DNA polymerase III subunit alpha n=1 Tax=Candidatus Buchananbacteria bacterium CG10_big_fil_rev_8_21_14_0_10_33_19 TaxID=1974525 RepID=A0A2H0W347_9BACT|nr:DNA polymerase III subunit alpha [Candidatus Falkowbacteria bacterium]PIS05793.1 MAG: DNA polymerase III subunit alpha [Candidatus Buchananbacteria bacterium CG10_big_fil_rev_8_21_14_0_10_33_19]
MSFVHLHTHSHYSMLDGLGKINDLVAKAVSFDMPALALTDHGVMYGAVEFYKAATKAGIKPIIGLEAYVARNGHQNKRSGIDVRPYHLILLAKNEEGYRNLVKLTTIANLKGFYYKPRIDWELLQKYSAGLICTTACLGGELANHIVNENIDLAKDMIDRYQKLFGSDSFYLEVQHNPSIRKQLIVNEKIYELSKETGAPIVATNDVHYLEKDDDQVQDILLCIQMKKVISDKDRMSMVGEDFSFLSPQEMKQNFADHPEAIENTLKIAKMCNFEMSLGHIVLPNFPLPEKKNEDEYLRDWCEIGLQKRFNGQFDNVVMERMDYELGIIAKTGYAGYFLIVADFINWAKDNGIVVGPGRGSAAGSLVSYLIGITNIDPIKYELVFERFLNPERISMPDIDTDFADSRRDDVLNYVAEKYGRDKVAQIITFGTMAARAAIRDVGRTMALPYNYCDRVAKLIPMFTKLNDAIETVPELKEVLNEEDGKKLLTAALRLEGVVRHASTHACGVVITPESLDNYSPRQFGSGGDTSIVVQYEGHSVEDLGLLKMDFLGLSNLTIIEQALEIINKIHGLKIDIEQIPLDDEKVFKLFQEGRTTGVFQLESSGMKRYLKQLLPTDLEDIIAMVALYRPGPMEYIPHYIDGKHGRKKPVYLHPKLQPILEKTYGVAVYQEQLLQIARDLAGFSYGEADILRKAVGKKIKALLDEQEVKIVSGMVKNGIDEQVAKNIWEFILPFAAYGFNRSHAACYAMIAYQTAYLKANYPAEYMAALLTSDQGNADRIAIEVEECRQLGIEVMSPDVNESFSTFTVVAESLKAGSPRIRFGLFAVKGLGENIVKVIINERRENGKFKNLEDFLTRIKNKDLNKRSLEAMVKAGVLDSLDERNRLLYNMDRILLFVKESNQNSLSGQDSLFDLTPQVSLSGLRLDNTSVLDKKQKLTWEKEYLGIYVSDHPMQELSAKLDGLVTKCSDLKIGDSKKYVKVAGVISIIKKIMTKKGDQMLFATIEDNTGNTEVLVFPRTLEENPHIWQTDSIVAILGKVSDKDDEVKVLCEKVAVLNTDNISEVFSQILVPPASGARGAGFWGRFKKGDGSKPVPVLTAPVSNIMNLVVNINEPIDYQVSKLLRELFFKHPGNHSVELLISRNSGLKQKVKTSFKVSSNDELVMNIENIVGQNSVVKN